MELNLKKIKWEAFSVEKIFTFEQCKCSKVNILKNGRIPYVGATTKNNGVMKFVEKNEKLISKGNCIVFICDGQGSVGYSIYKKEDFIGSTTLKIGRNKNINKYSGLFLTTVLNQNKSIYDYGYKRNLKRLKKEQIFLPITKTKTPDWKFMEEFIKFQYKEQLNKYITFLSFNNKKIDYYNLIPLNKKNWKSFLFTEIFEEIIRGKRLKKGDQKFGNIPYISSTAKNNGIDNFISNSKNTKQFEYCISIANSGSVGASFFHNYKFIASDHITILKNAKMNKYSYLFISTIAKRLSDKYNFNRELNDKRISRERILLPVNDNNDPDYYYMEQFIKNILKNKYSEILNSNLF